MNFIFEDLWASLRADLAELEVKQRYILFCNEYRRSPHPERSIPTYTLHLNPSHQDHFFLDFLKKAENPSYKLFQTFTLEVGPQTYAAVINSVNKSIWGNYSKRNYYKIPLPQLLQNLP